MALKEKHMDMIGADLRDKIKELGQLWKRSENCPKIPLPVLDSWGECKLNCVSKVNILFFADTV